MNRSEIHRAVARATGDDIRTVRQHGFQLLPDLASEETDEVRLGVVCRGCGRFLSVGNEPERIAECPRCDAFLPFDESELLVGTEALATCA